jgi:hypothetical protein
VPDQGDTDAGRSEGPATHEREERSLWWAAAAII